MNIHLFAGFLLAACCSCHTSGQLPAQRYALNDFRVSGALLSVPILLHDTVRPAVIMNHDLYGLFYDRSKMSVARYRRTVERHIDRAEPIKIVDADVNNYGFFLSDPYLEPILHESSTSKLLAEYFGTDSILNGDPRDHQTAAVLSCLFHRGVIVYVDDESGAVLIDRAAPDSRERSASAH